MAVDLKRITKGRVQLAPRVLIHAFDGIGKTQFAAGAPDPFFLDVNRGSGEYDVQRVTFDQWEETFEWLAAIEAGQVKCETVVLDTAGDLEAMSHKKLFGNDVVTKHEGGYGKGDDVVVMEWRKLLYQLERLHERGKGIIFTSHTRVRGYNNPEGPSFDRFELSLRAPLAGLLRGWCDYVFFAQVQTGIAQEKGGRPKGTTTGERFMYTRRTPAYDAKARGTSLFPERLPLSYAIFAEERRADSARTGEMAKEIDAMLAEIGDAKYAETVRSYIKKWPTQIAESHNRVKIKLTEKQEAAAAASATEQPAAASAA